MNNIFKTKWNAATQSYVVCSELAKRAGKRVGSAVVLSAISAGVMAADITPDANGRYIATTSGEITGTTTTTIDNNVISIGNGANVTINGDMTVNSHLTVVNGSEIVTVQGGNASLQADKLTINGTTAVAGQRLHPYAFLVRNNAYATIEDLTVNLKVPHEFTNGDAVGSNVDGGFGIALGTEHYNNGTSTITVKNANINVSNTENSKLGGYYQNLPLFGNTKALHKGGQITGLYVGTNIDADTTYTSTGLTKILAQDISTDKTAGDYIMGVYVYGPKSKVILNDSDIKVASQGGNSFTLKIGNFENNGTSYKGEIVSTGKMKLDSTEAPNSPTILLVSSDSKLDASAETASANIQSANSAVVFGVTDLVYKNAMGELLAALGGDLSRNKSAENQSVKLNNAVISTTSENASLIKADSALDVDSLANSQSGLTWSNGDFTTKGEFILSGKDSLATAAKNGWLFEVENGSTLNVTLDKEAKVVGQVSKNDSGTLNVTLDKAAWTLNKKGTGEQRSSVNSLSLRNKTVLDATRFSAADQEELDQSVVKAEDNLTAKNNDVTSKENQVDTAKQNLANKEDYVIDRQRYLDSFDPATFARRPTETDAQYETRKNNVIAARQKQVNDAKKAVETAKTALQIAETNLEVAKQAAADAQTALDTAKTNAQAGPQDQAIYFIKLTSNGTDNDGTLINDGSVITQANSSSKDILTIEGNYEGKNGAVLKVNTDWNSPGDDVEGTDSISDLLVITGNASGSTIVQAIKADGSENVIDGDIGSIAADLYKNSAVVVRVKGTDSGVEGDLVGPTYKTRSSFTGEARTTGAGLLKLTSRVNTNNETEYFWTISQTNSTNSPTYDPVVPAYVLAPQANLELGYTTLATLHERRGENQTLAWDDCGNCGEKARGQSWGRIFGKHLELNGKTRLGAKHNIYGFQLGHDFAIQRTEEGGHRLTGGYVSYGTMNSTYSDRFDDEAQTGKGKQKGWNLGLTHTRYAPNGAYVDLVGQIGFLNNNYQARNGVEAKQKGTALALSVEVGRPYGLREHKTNEGVWLIEPQAQLMYQMLKLKDFKDDIKHIKGGSHHGLRARLGVRLAYNTQAAEDKYRTNTFYVIANLLQDFSKGKGVQIGQDKVKETFAKTWAEVGLGGQLPVGKQSYVYADARYERSLSGAKREGYRGTVGFKYTWK